MYKQQQNTHYPQRWQILRREFLEASIGSQPAIEGMPLICGGRRRGLT